MVIIDISFQTNNRQFVSPATVWTKEIPQFYAVNKAGRKYFPAFDISADVDKFERLHYFHQTVVEQVNAISVGGNKKD